jgi:hypothetical protein
VGGEVEVGVSEVLERAKDKLAEIGGGTGWPLIMPEEARALAAEVERLEAALACDSGLLAESEGVVVPTLQADNTALREQVATLQADARLGAMVRRMPEMLDEERGPDSVAAVLLSVHRDYGWVVEEHDAWGGGVKHFCYQPPEGGLYVPIRDPLDALAAALGEEAPGETATPATPTSEVARNAVVAQACRTWLNATNENDPDYLKADDELAAVLEDTYPEWRAALEGETPC